VLYVLNFGHPLSGAALADLATQTPATEVRVSLQVNFDEPTPAQVSRAVDRAALELEKLGGARLDGTAPVAVVVHGISEVTALLLAELHGRLGVFPMLLALRQDPVLGVFRLSSHPEMFGGVLHLERLRQAARERRRQRIEAGR
jgi:hypothetical protein